MKIRFSQGLFVLCALFLLAFIANQTIPASALARCWIEYFDASPGSPVNTGAEVSLRGKGACDGGVRAVKFLINGQSRAEIGAPEQSETWRTGEFGPGTYEVCFIVAGHDDPNWSSAAKNCKSYEVRGSQPPPEIKCYVDSFSINPTSAQPGASISLSGSGHCDGAGVRAVRFSINGQPWGEFGGPSTSASWNTSGLGAGNYTIGFHVAAHGDPNWDKQGVSYQTVKLENAPPPEIKCYVDSFNINPTKARPGDSISLSGGGHCDGAGVRAVRFSVNGQPFGEFAGPSTTANWNTAGLGAGSYTIGIHVAAHGDPNWDKQGVSYQTVTLENAPPPEIKCYVDSFNVNPSSARPGDNISLSGSGHCDGAEVRAVRFSINGQPFGEFAGPNTTTSWNTSGLGAGNYNIGFHVAAHGDPNWDKQGVSYQTVKLESAQAPSPEIKCYVDSFNINPTTARPGASISLSGSGHCDGAEVRAVRFSVNGQPFGEFAGPNTTASWNTSSLGVGSYNIGFHVAAHGDPNWDKQGVSYQTVKLESAPAPAPDIKCFVDSFKINPASAQPGTSISLTGSGHCTGAEVRAVRFSVNGQPFGEFAGPSTTASWNTSGLSVGSYTIGFHVSAHGDPNWDKQGVTYQTVKLGTESVTPPDTQPDTKCYVDSFGASPKTARPGEKIQLSGSGHCNGIAVRAVRFSVNGQPFGEFAGPSTTSTWDTSGFGLGSYTLRFHVAAVGDTDWSSAASSAITIKIAEGGSDSGNNPDPSQTSCTIKSFTIDPTDAIVGTKFTFSGEGQCGSGTPKVRFLIGGQPVEETAGANAKYQWNSTGVTPSIYAIAFQVTSGQWDQAATSVIDLPVYPPAASECAWYDVICKLQKLIDPDPVSAWDGKCTPQCVTYARGERPDTNIWALGLSTPQEWLKLANGGVKYKGTDGKTYTVTVRGSGEAPQAGDLVIWGSSCGDDYASGGHVGIVYSYQDGTLLVNDRNWGEGACTLRTKDPRTIQPCMSFISSPKETTDSGNSGGNTGGTDPGPGTSNPGTNNPPTETNPPEEGGIIDKVKAYLCQRIGWFCK